MRFIIAAAIVFAGSFLPLYVVGTLDPTSNPIGLGLLFLAGSSLAGILAVTGVVLILWRKIFRR
jgi:hypothetical protein